MSGIVVRKNFGPVERAVRQASEAAVLEAAEHLLEESNRTVPHQDGDLTRSGEVSQDGLTSQVSYNTPYARVQHERTWYRHDSGRRAKWLESAFKERASAVQAWLAVAIRRRVR